LTTESRHQAWISSAVNKNEPWSGPYDTPVGFNVVYSAAAAFITSCPASNPALPFTAFPALTYDATTGAVTGASDGQYIALYQGLNIATYPVQGGKVQLPATQGTAYITATSEKNATLVSDDNIVAGRKSSRPRARKHALIIIPHQPLSSSTTSRPQLPTRLLLSCKALLCPPSFVASIYPKIPAIRRSDRVLYASSLSIAKASCLV
jgi:hypothetical protein